MGKRAARWTSAIAVILLSAGVATAQEVQTIRPGMTTEDVKAAFGEPAAIRTYGDYTYYFYQNGVEREYGTADIVFFLDGQVVDAVLRSSRREYAGESSSPRGVTPKPTPAGMRLEVPGAVESVEVRTAQPPPPPQPQPEVEEERPAAPPPLPPPMASSGTEFEDFVPICVQSFVDSEIFQRHEASPLCECTANESKSMGVEPATIARITEALKSDPSALSQDERVQQAGSTCIDRIMGEANGRRDGAEADTSGTGG